MFQFLSTQFLLKITVSIPGLIHALKSIGHKLITLSSSEIMFVGVVRFQVDFLRGGIFTHNTDKGLFTSVYPNVSLKGRLGFEAFSAEFTEMFLAWCNSSSKGFQGVIALEIFVNETQV